MKKLLSICVLTIPFSLLCVRASAGVPQQINYQGKLAGPNGGLIVCDTVQMQFNIYDLEIGGTSLWSETHHGVAVKNGLFSVVLGSQTSIPYSVFNGETRYLGIRVEQDAEVTPRMPIMSAGYAFRSQLSDTAEYARVARGVSDKNWQISEHGIYHSAGNVGIGTSSPEFLLDVDGAVNAKIYYGDGSHLTGTKSELWTDAGTYIYANNATDVVVTDDSEVGIGTTTPSASLDVQGSVKVGVDDTGYDVDLYGAESGSRVFWDESKMAFRAGRVTSDQWDDGNVGQYSLASGLNAKASGLYSTAMGCGVIASGNASIALGNTSTASGEYSTAMGYGSHANGGYAIAMGHAAIGTGDRATALGTGVIASADNATAIGAYLTASAEHSIVLGRGSNALNPLVNDTAYTLMVGFNSTTPTFYVDANRVGIGTTEPDAKLTVKAGSDGMVLKGYNNSDEVIVEIGEGLDYSETFPTAHDDVAPGMVMVIDPVNKGNLTVSTQPYDTKVAGIIAGANGLGSGVRLGTRDGDNGDHAVALAGRVYCNIDTEYGDVKPGDLLTTSPTPGHAMAVKDYSKAQGAILGKAMEGLSGGQKGRILVLVTLQ